MLFLLLQVVLFYCIVPSKCSCPIDLHCSDSPLNQSKVENYCQHNLEGVMSGRCCLIHETVIGLDLRNCEIRRLNLTHLNVTEVFIMDLRDNDFEKFTSQDLVGYTGLEILYLPFHFNCPGGVKAWNSTSHDNNMTSCYGQMNPCITLNISCTENGDCIHTGPGTAKCVCIAGHYGYKCMNEGEFPINIFSVSVIFPTIILCIALWFVQGRDVNRKMNTTIQVDS